MCEQIEALQRRALNALRPELVVKVDRSGLNEHHPLVQKLYAAIDRVLKPIVADEERRASAHLIGTARAITARDQVGLRALNDALKAAFDHPGSSGREPGSAPASAAPDEHSSETVEPDDSEETNEREAAELPASPVVAALFFKQSPIRMHPGEQRTITIHANPDQVPAGTQLQVDADPGLSLSLRSTEFSEPGARGLSAIAGSIRAKVTGEPGSRLIVTTTAGEHQAQLEVVIVRHRA